MEIQFYNGKEYKLYPNEKYFSRGTKRLHRVVWESHNGQIPKGYDIHHIDSNTHNNDITNKYLYYFFIFNSIKKYAKGSIGIGSLNKKSLYNIEIPDLSLQE